MKLVIFSDTHLTEKFNFKLFNKLQRAISDADLIIINGDFWDQYLTTFDQFMNSPWRALFKQLKQHKTVYLFGNHDRETQSDDRRLQFCDEVAEFYEIEIGKRKLRIEHGNRFVSDSHPPRWFGKLTFWVQALLVKVRPLTIFLRIIQRKWNRKMKTWATENLEDDQLLICGHSHLQEQDLSSKFINAGFNCYGHHQYLVIEDDNLTLIRDRY